MNRSRRLCILISLILSSFGFEVSSQIPDIPIPKFEYDSNYVIKYDNLLALRLVSPRRVYDFRLRNTASRRFLAYRPNLQNAFGLGLSYKWLAFDATFNPKWNNKKNEKLGETKEFNLKAMLYLERDIVELFYRRYTGLHISNPDDYLDPWDGTYTYRPDIINQNLSLMYSIPFNGKKYSLRTTFLLDGRQKKSSGSVMYTGGINIQSMAADSSIVPVEYHDNFDAFARINRYGVVMLQNSIGYSYTFIYRKFYLTLSAMPGINYVFGKVYSEGGNYNTSSFNFLLLSRSGFGYNGRRWYAGLYFIYQNQSAELRKGLALNNNMGEIRFFVGYRLQAPNFLRSVIKD